MESVFCLYQAAFSKCSPNWRYFLFLSDQPHWGPFILNSNFTFTNLFCIFILFAVSFEPANGVISSTAVIKVIKSERVFQPGPDCGWTSMWDLFGVECKSAVWRTQQHASFNRVNSIQLLAKENQPQTHNEQGVHI